MIESQAVIKIYPCCLVILALACSRAPAVLAQEAAPIPQPVVIRVCTFAIGDVRTADLRRKDDKRVRSIAEVLQRLRPNVVLLTGMTYDTPGGPDFKEGESAGQNAARFIENYLNEPQADGLRPMAYKAFMAPVNAGVPSGKDLNNDGRVVDTYPAPPGRMPDGTDLPWSGDAHAYSADCWGEGAFPGQGGMALLVDSRLRILTSEIRTFRTFPWEYMPGNQMAAVREAPGTQPIPKAPPVLRLASVAHWDVPVELPNGQIVHLLCSAPARRGPDDASLATRRNHDEIRFWADYVEEQGYCVDDANRGGGLEAGLPFVILGNLEAPPEIKSGLDPIATVLLGARRVNGVIVPTADGSPATTVTGERLDYVLPSKDLGIAAAGVFRQPPESSPLGFPSTHFPVWMELQVDPKAPEPGR